LALNDLDSFSSEGYWVEGGARIIPRLRDDVPYFTKFPFEITEVLGVQG
jgi:hypothetical protein